MLVLEICFFFRAVSSFLMGKSPQQRDPEDAGEPRMREAPTLLLMHEQFAREQVASLATSAEGT